MSFISLLPLGQKLVYKHRLRLNYGQTFATHTLHKTQPTTKKQLIFLQTGASYLFVSVISFFLTFWFEICYAAHKNECDALELISRSYRFFSLVVVAVCVLIVE